MVSQNSSLFPHMTVYDNIAYPLRCRKLEDCQLRERIANLADDFAVTHLLKRKPQTLSGGESQRVSLARAVAAEPRCLLLDEPISSLDTKSRFEMRTLLRRLNTNSRAIVHVTHDYTEAVSLGAHIAVMEKGKIAQIGTKKEIFQHPKSEFIARFVGIRNFFGGRLEKLHDEQVNAKRFITNGLGFLVLTDRADGPGYIMVRSEDVTICNTVSQTTSALNNFEGTIVDIASAGIGVEVMVDIGIEIAALITAESVKRLDLQCGKKVWVSFKASAAKYIEQ
jgi:molybdopterin-binding protein